MERSGISRARGAVSLADLRTPIVENFLSMLPMGHEKALKNAFYNVLALVLAAFAILASWTVYCILEPFFKPLLWALLVGSVLHPFKANLSSWTRRWLKSVKRSSYPLALHVVLTPFTIADSLSDKIGNYVWTFWKSILAGLGVFFVSYIFYYNPPVQLAYFIQWTVSRFLLFIYWALSWLNWQMVFTLNTVYVGYIAHFVMQHRNKAASSTDESPVKTEENPKNHLDSTIPEAGDETDLQKTPEISPPAIDDIDTKSKWTRTLSYANWTLTSLFIGLQLPTPLLIISMLFILIGILSFLKGQPSGSRYNISNISRKAYLMVRNIGSGQRNLEASSSSMVSQIVSPRRGASGGGDFIKRKIGSPKVDDLGGTEDSDDLGSSPPFNSSNCPGAESTFSEDKKLRRSWSEGSGKSFRPQSFEQKLGDEVSPKSMPSPILNNTELDGKDNGVDGNSLIDSNRFLYGVLCACIVVQIWNRLWLLHLLPIPVVYYGIKKFCTKVGITEYWEQKIKKPFFDFYSDLQDPASEQIFPAPVRVTINILIRADKKVVSICEAYLDPVVASLVLILVVIGTILGLIFAAIQVYGEGDHLVRVSVNLINSTVSQYPEINNVLPEGWEGIMDSMVGNAYVHGKEYITNMIRDSVSEKNPEKAEQIERQVIELVDRIYLAWNQTWDNTALKTSHGINENTGQGFEWDELLETGKEMPKLLEMSVLANYAKANVGTIWAIMESLWNILIGNISLVVSAVTAVMSLLFGGGTALLNLVLNLVVFFTALFYILRSKSSTYKPVELFNRYASGSSPYAKKLATAVEEAVNGVFSASFKMSAFYGMWTWLVHTLFQVNIVFIPSIFAALFGAVPILGPYWAAVPAVLELWLIQGHWTKAILMFCAQMAPMSVVDTQIYCEIKGAGHPYLTGLAVAGGIFCFGMQGAIMGPLVLCCFFVAMKIGNSFLRGEGHDTELEAAGITRRFYPEDDSSLRQHSTPPTTTTTFGSSTTTSIQSPHAVP